MDFFDFEAAFFAAGFFVGFSSASASLPGAESDASAYFGAALLPRPRDSRGAGASPSLETAFLALLAFLGFLAGWQCVR